MKVIRAAVISGLPCSQRAKVRKRSSLEDVEGIGPKRRQALLRKI